MYKTFDFSLRTKEYYELILDRTVYSVIYIGDFKKNCYRGRNVFTDLTSWISDIKHIPCIASNIDDM